MKRNIKLLVVLFIVFFTSITVEASSNPQRISGSDRVATSVRVSQEAYNKSNTVILAGYGGQVDSLSGTILAHFKNAPMLLTRQSKLDDITLREIERLGAKEVYILGGETVVSKDVEASLSKYKVTRVSGDKREETAVDIARHVVGHRANEVFLTLGYNEYADALAIGPISGKQRKPIFLTKTGSIPGDTQDALKSFGVKKVTIIGGEAVVSKTVENQLKAMNISFNRISGDNRMATALKIAKEYTPNPSSLIVANGYRYADAVIGGYLAAKENAPILLTRDKLVDIDSLDYIGANKKHTYVLGGENVIYNGVLEDMDYVLNRNVVIKDEVTRMNYGGSLKDVLDRVYYRNGEQFKRQNIRTTVVKR